MVKDTWKKNPTGPAYVIGVTNFVYRQELPRLANRAAMYRCVLRHLRLIPDPVIWAHVAPLMRELCSSKPRKSTLNIEELRARTMEGVRTEEDLSAYKEEKRRQASLASCREMVAEVRAAVACHPHALMRLIKNAYGQRGPARYKAFKSIEATSPIRPIPRRYEQYLGVGRPPVPVPLLPLIQQSKAAHLVLEPDDESGPSRAPAAQSDPSRRQVRIQWLKDYESVETPMCMPLGSGVQTGNENKGWVESLHAFAKIGQSYGKYGIISEAPVAHLTEKEQPTESAYNSIPLPRGYDLPSFKLLPYNLQMVFPKKLKPTMREPPMPKPPRHETKGNPKTWKHPVRLTPRLLTRAYQRIWDELVWTRPEGQDPQGEWVQCRYEEVLLWEQGRWEELDQVRRTSEFRLSPAIKQRVSDMTQSEAFWVRRNREVKESKGRVDRVLDKHKWRAYRQENQNGNGHQGP